MIGPLRRMPRKVSGLDGGGVPVIGQGIERDGRCNEPLLR
jgi:hypothetical protein